MKKYRFLVLLFTTLWITTSATKQENTKIYSHSWTTTEIQTLNISNKFGEVRVENSNGNQITIDVKVTVDGYGKRNEEILNGISVSFSKSGNNALAETKFTNNLNIRGSGKMSIDYVVNIPQDKNLNITNKFGNVIIRTLTGKGNIKVDYGSLIAAKLIAPGSQNMLVDISYGSANIESITDGGISVAYSKLFIDNAETLRLDTKYSEVNANNADNIRFISKYDTYKIDKVNEVVGDGKYTNFSINKLSSVLKITSGYGSVDVKNVSSDFKEIVVDNKYASVSIGIEEGVSYNIVAECSYCNITYPKNQFKGNSITENNRQSLSGNIGSNPDRAVRVSSKYGNIKLTR